MGRPKKIKIEVKEVAEVPTKEEIVLSEKEVLLLRQDCLLGLRSSLVKEGIDSVGKLDQLLAQVNQRIKELE